MMVPPLASHRRCRGKRSLSGSTAAIAELMQQLAHRVRADRVAHLLKRFSEFDVALGNPQQRSHRVAERDRLDQTTQILQQRWILGCQPPPPAPGPADPPGRWRW